MQLGHFDFLSGTRELATLGGGSPIAGGATFNGITYNAGPFHAFNQDGIPMMGKAAPSLFRAIASSDVAGTLNIQQSPDGTNWFTTATAVIAADFTKATPLEDKIIMEYFRAQIVNGASIETKVEFQTTLVSV